MEKQRDRETERERQKERETQREREGNLKSWGIRRRIRDGGNSALSGAFSHL